MAQWTKLNWNNSFANLQWLPLLCQISGAVHWVLWQADWQADHRSVYYLWADKIQVNYEHFKIDYRLNYFTYRLVLHGQTTFLAQGIIACSISTLVRVLILQMIMLCTKKWSNHVRLLITEKQHYCISTNAFNLSWVVKVWKIWKPYIFIAIPTIK